MTIDKYELVCIIEPIAADNHSIKENIMNAFIAKLANVLAAKGKGQAAVFQAMKATAYDVCTNKDGSVSGSVITDQAYNIVKAHMTAHQFAGYVSALSKDGAYRARSEGFGTVYLGKDVE